ncbi:AB hydrolase superfamily protein C1039.03-like, partial [Lingula anatina]|uniref:AB hydrolase superfamily protein C1039.03-like n=1 Tax=Lingula anatina TaxID=7574 RepID=A0A1S3IYV5_LINAN
VLVYPVFDLRCNTASYKLYSDGYSLTEKQMQWYANHFLNNEEEKSDPRASPLLRQSFSHLPPALCIVTGSDVLVDENMEYVQKLKDAGVETELVVMKGVVHSYFVLPAFFRENIAFSYAKVADFIKKHST